MKTILTICSFLLTLVLAAQPVSFSPYGVGGGGAMFFPRINPANDNEFYISCDMSEMFHSEDFGVSYSQIPFTKFQCLNVSTYEFTSNPDIAYSNFNDGNDGYPVKTDDGGETWVKLPGFDANLGGVYRMYANYSNAAQLIMNYYGDVVISNDGGNTFSLVKHCADNGVGIITCGVFFDGATIYVATNEGIFISGNSGSTFTKMTTSGFASGEIMWHFSAAKSGSATRFLCITGAAGDIYNGLMPYEYSNVAKGIYIMDNASGNWVAKSAGIDVSNDFVMYTGMALNDINTMYLAGSDNALNAPLVFKSTDAGTTWNKVFRSTDNQNIVTGWSGYKGDKNWSWGETAFGIAVAPTNSDKVVFGDFGFVHVSKDGGNSWNQAYVDQRDQHQAGVATPQKKSYHSIGLENTTCWQIFWADAKNMFACFSDIGGIRSMDGGESWGFDYAGFSVNSLYRMVETNGGTLYGACSNIHDMYQSTRLQDAKLDAADGNGKVVFSSDHGNTWNTLHSFNHPVFWLAADPNNAKTLYASVIHYANGTGTGGIWVTKDLQNGAASTWTKLPNPPRTEGHPASIIVLHDGKVLCSYSGRRNSGGTFTKSSGVFLFDPVTSNWNDVSDPGMQYWTKDIVIDPNDATQNTWYACVFSGWGGAPNGLGGLYKTKNRGLNWTKITGSKFDRVTSITFNPSNTSQAYLTTETQGLWVSRDIQSSNPTFSLVESYPFRQPERVYFNPFNLNEMWVSSFGNGMKMGLLNVTTGISPEPVNKTGLKIWPNPFADQITVPTSDALPGDFITITHISGDVTFKIPVSSTETSIDTRLWKKGMYILSYKGSVTKAIKTD